LKRTCRILVGLALLLVVLPAVSALLPSVAPGGSPYVSALSDLTVSTTLAAKPCPMSYCNLGVCDSPGKAAACVVDKKTGACTTVLCNA
jgi:hypothetical protein